MYKAKKYNNMERKPKISITHYLNKKVKPAPKDEAEFYSESEDKEYLPEYPIYYYITIKRKTIHKPSKISQFLPENLFDKNIEVNGGSLLQDLMKAERNIITKISEIFLTDYEAGKVEGRYCYLFRRGFSAKDEFINGLNSYIEFYTQSLFSLVHRYKTSGVNKYILEKLGKNIDTSMFNPAGDKLNILLDYQTINPRTETEFLKKNVSADLLNAHFLSLYLYECLAVTNIKYGYDLPLIEWIKGDLKNDILTQAESRKERLKQFCGDFGFNKTYFEQYFEPIINKVISIEWQENEKIYW